MVRLSCVAVFLMAILGLAGCASSEVPITSATPQKPDARLIGMWRADAFNDAEGEVELFKVSRLSDGRLVLEDGARKGPPEAEEMLAVITAEISGSHFASIGALDAKEPRTHYFLVRYEVVSKDRLQLYIATMERLEQAVRNGWIDGKRQPDRHLETFPLKADAKGLREFIVRHGREVFSEPGIVLERVPAE
jgi:hypothetical protein